MKDIDILNGFFARPDLNESEQILKSKCVELKRRVEGLGEELKGQRQSLAQKEDEIKSASSQFDVLLQLALEQEKARLFGQVK